MIKKKNLTKKKKTKKIKKVGRIFLKHTNNDSQ